MATLPRIQVEHLLNTYLSLPDDIRERSPSFHIGLSVVKYYLGEDWLEKHLNPLVAASGFMRLMIEEADKSYIQRELSG
jgi:hypothetical protein